MPELIYNLYDYNFFVIEIGIIGIALIYYVFHIIQVMYKTNANATIRYNPNISTTPITAMGFSAMFTFQLDNTKS